MLRLEGVESGYGKKKVLFGLDLEVREREIVAIIGPNGAGKTTVLKAIAGLIPVWGGVVRFGGQSLNGLSVVDVVRMGITFAPQGGRVFDQLSVVENLQIGGLRLSKDRLEARMEEVLDLFPELRKLGSRNAAKLSGGEQQMLAVARALMNEPRLLMLDEPSLGLSPGLVNDVFGKIQEIREISSLAILIVEQKARRILEIADRAYGVRLGSCVIEGTPDLFLAGDNLRGLFLT